MVLNIRLIGYIGGRTPQIPRFSGNFKAERLIFIIQVNKEEIMAIRKKYPNIQFVRTCKQRSSRHNYYVVETKQVAKMLDAMRGTSHVK